MYWLYAILMDFYLRARKQKKKKVQQLLGASLEL